MTPVARRCYSALVGPATVAAWMWLDASEDIAFGADILLSAAAALAQDLRLIDTPADGRSATGSNVHSTLDEKAAAAAGGEQGAGTRQLRNVENAAAIERQAAGACWCAHKSSALPNRLLCLPPSQVLCLAVIWQDKCHHMTHP